MFGELGEKAGEVGGAARMRGVGTWATALGAGIAIAAGTMSPAHAVDVENRDRVAREIVVNTNDGDSKIVTLKPRETVVDVCKGCVILSGDTSVEATGKVTVRIEGGKVSIAKR